MEIATTIVFFAIISMTIWIFVKKKADDKKQRDRIYKFEKELKYDANTKKGITCGIVTYNSAEEINVALSSLVERIDEKDIYVFDNASTDETVSIIKEKFPEVNLIESKSNLGFGAGHNQILKEINSNYHIIVNPDIEIKEDTINELEECLNKNEDVICATPLILNMDGTEQKLPKRYPKIKYFIGGRLENKFKFAKKLRSEYTRSDERLTELADIEFCSGCFMFVRTNALLKIGGFDERYFLHFEDADLTRMLQKKGRTVYYPKAIVIHKWKRDNVKNKKIAKIALQSMFKYFMKWGY